MNEEEIKETIDNMSEEELNEFIFFALKEMTKKYENAQAEIEKKNNMYIKEYNEHMEKKRQNGVLINNELILKRELKKKDKVMRAIIKAYKQDMGSHSSIESTIKYFEKEVEAEEKRNRERRK